jgi:hypothetical protein
MTAENPKSPHPEFVTTFKEFFRTRLNQDQKDHLVPLYAYIRADEGVAMIFQAREQAWGHAG